MARKSTLKLYKQRFDFVIELLSLRLRLLGISWQNYQNGLVVILISAAISLILLLSGLLSLLLALQAALPTAKAAWVFATMAAVFVLCSALLIVWMRTQLRTQGKIISDFAKDISEDLRFMHGQTSHADIRTKEINDEE